VPYKKYFINCNYRSIDSNPKCNPDILADIHNIPLDDNCADGVICKSVLEHVLNPIKVVGEIRRILKPGGKCFLSVPFIHAYHGNDYWRFSEDAIKYMFKEFKHMEFVPVMGHFETIAFLLPYANKFPMSCLLLIARFFDNVLFNFQSGKQVLGYNIFVIK